MIRCKVEIDINSITSSGTRLTTGSELYLSICLFGRIQQTECVPAIFPLTFLETFVFERIFHSAYDLTKVIDILEETQVRIDLIQASHIFDGIRVLAWYQDSAKNFLYPAPTYDVPLYRINDRELFMRRSHAFLGISPKLEFSTRTTIVNSSSKNDEGRSSTGDTVVHQRRTRSQSRKRSASRSSTSLTSLLTAKPPFVVRKVEDNLIGRKPILASSESGATMLHESDRDREGSETSLSTVMNGSTGTGRRRHKPHNGDVDVEQRCAVCRLYRQYYGCSYPGHISPDRRSATHH